MSNPNQAQVIQPANTLKMRMGGGRFSLDADAVARAEAALKSLSGQFSQWMNDELEKLDAAHPHLQRVGRLNDLRLVGIAHRPAPHEIPGGGRSPFIRDPGALSLTTRATQTENCSARTRSSRFRLASNNMQSWMERSSATSTETTSRTS